MIKRTLFLSSDAYLYTRHKQLIIDFVDKEKTPVSIPIEDIGVIVLEAYQMTMSLNLISRMLENNVAIITCDYKKMPQGLMLNLEGNTLQQERFRSQIDSSKPLKKQLWQQTVKAKIRNQGALLAKYHLLPVNKNGYPKNFEKWANAVRSGDPDNLEGRAAAYYWKTLFSQYIPDFVRGRDQPPPNNLLNYAYAILRAVTARSLVASGLLPTLGIHHHNRYNAYALADDIMEPYRPFVDKIVYGIVAVKKETLDFELTKELKAELLKIPAIDVIIDGEKSPLMIAMQRTTTSLARCFGGFQRKILFPVLK